MRVLDEYEPNPDHPGYKGPLFLAYMSHLVHSPMQAQTLHDLGTISMRHHKACGARSGLGRISARSPHDLRTISA